MRGEKMREIHHKSEIEWENATEIGLKLHQDDLRKFLNYAEKNEGFSRVLILKEEGGKFKLIF